ncbi:MAG: HD family hydrolase [Deltaproteobacteria bacterium]|nr:HD family hydrolase [Deltaproteobacteria bacterium]
MTENLDSIFYYSTMMKFLPRAGWLMKGVKNPESLADHSFGVAFSTMMMGKEIIQDGRWELDLEKAIQIALIHDLAESLITDIPSPMIRFFGEKNKYNAEKAALYEIFSSSIWADEMVSLWEEFEQNSTAEGRLVRAADKIDMVLQLCRYEEAGNRSLDDFWSDSETIFSGLGGSETEREYYSGIYEKIKSRHLRKYM